MRVYLIKHTGATIWQNMFFDREFTFADNNKIHSGILFFRKKDAETYLKTLEYKEFYEVVGATVEVKKPAVSGWVSVTDALPKPLQTVWLTNGKGWCSLGCLIEDAEGWHWAESNGVIYIENAQIVSECESEDLDVKFWHELPKPPCL